MTEPRPTPTALAREVLSKHNVTAAPVPIERIAKAEGARIQFGPLDRELSGMFFIRENVPIIGVNSLHHPNRQRFTIAHELGHLLMHKDQLGTGVHVDKELAILWRDAQASAGTDAIEVQANQFAAQILVPDFLLLEIVGSNVGIADNEQELEALAKRFKVSAMTIQLRLSRWFGEKTQR